MKKKREEDARAVLKRLRVVTEVKQQQQGQQTAQMDHATEESKHSDDEKKPSSSSTAAAQQATTTPADELFLQPRPIHDTLDEEVEEMRSSIAKEERAKTASWSDLFTPQLRLRMLYGCGIQACQQLTYINAVMYYSTIIFSAVGISPLAATALTGAVNVIATTATITYVDRLGRIPLLLTGAVGMLVSSLLVACVSSLSPVNADNASNSSASGLLIVLFVCCHVTCFAFSWGPIGWVRQQTALIHRVSPLACTLPRFPLLGSQHPSQHYQLLTTHALVRLSGSSLRLFQLRSSRSVCVVKP